MTWPARRPAVPENCKDLDLEIVEHALVEARGNVTAAARSLSLPSVDLRKLIWATPSLADAAYEQLERTIDNAIGAVMQGLRNPELSRRLQAAAFLLKHSEAARRRGWGKGRPRRKPPEPGPVTRSSGSTSSISVREARPRAEVPQ
jgi:hypothetical protein